MFPVISTDGATFIDDNSLFFTGCSFVALMKGFKILFVWTGDSYTYTSVSESSFGNIDLWVIVPFFIYSFGNILFESIRVPIRDWHTNTNHLLFTEYYTISLSKDNEAARRRCRKRIPQGAYSKSKIYLAGNYRLQGGNLQANWYQKGLSYFMNMIVLRMFNQGWLMPDTFLPEKSPRLFFLAAATQKPVLVEGRQVSARRNWPRL